MFKLSHAFGLSLLITLQIGCASQQFQADVQKLQAECSRKYETMPGSSALSGKVSLRGVDGITTAMLINENFPTEQDKALLLKLDEIHTDCSRKLIDIARQRNHPLSDILDINYKSAQLLFARLVAGAMTYAQYNRARVEMNTKFVQIAQDYMLAVQARDIAARQAAASNLQAAAAALLLMQPQPQPIRTPTPVTTNCRWIGSTLNCNSF